jgi:hypothetical protein
LRETVKVLISQIRMFRSEVKKSTLDDDGAQDEEEA